MSGDTTSSPVRHDPIVKAELLAELGALAGEVVREEAAAAALAEPRVPEFDDRWEEPRAAAALREPARPSPIDGDLRRGLIAELQGLSIVGEHGFPA